MAEEQKPSQTIPAPTHAAESRTGGAPPAKPGRGALLLALVALLIALSSAGGGAYIGYRGLELETSADRQRETLVGVQSELNDLKQAVVSPAALDAAVSPLKAGLDDLSQQNNVLNDQFATMRGLVEGGRAAWLRSEAGYLLQMANQALQLRGDVTTSLRALKLADRSLELLADPRLLPVRAALAEEMVALRAVAIADIEGIALQLSSLSAQSEQWPLTRHVPGPFTHGTREIPPNGGEARSPWQRFVSSVLATLHSIVVIRRHDEPIATLAAPEIERLQRLQTKIALESARLALLQRNQDSFREQIRSAIHAIDDYFATDQPPVQSALAQLEEMWAAPLAPELPNLTQSLTLLRDFEASMVTP